MCETNVGVSARTVHYLTNTMYLIVRQYASVCTSTNRDNAQWFYEV